MKGFFSRWKPTPEDVAFAVSSASQNKPRHSENNDSVAQNLRTKVATIKPKKGDDLVIQNLRDVPKGIYWWGFDSLEKEKEDFFCILTPDESMVLIISEQQWAGHQRFNLIKQLKGHGYTDIKPILATREIIRALNHQTASEQLQSENADLLSEVEQTAWQIIDKAVESKASDIHIETRGASARIFYRIHSTRVEQPMISTDRASEICRVLYGVHADADNKETSWDPKAVMDTSIEHITSTGSHVQLRFSSGPIYPSGNFHAVIRVLQMDESSSKTLEDIGYTPEQLAEMEDMLVGAQGIVLMVGPTNSGKSTTMQAMIKRVYDRRGQNTKVITVEDPVEYLIEGACQMGVPKKRKILMNERSGSIYTTFLHGTLRQDPDVVMIGEIRSQETAQVMTDLALVGRKLLTTLHAYEGMAVYPRFTEIGVPESVLYRKGFISGIIYQRLVPELCPHCSIPASEGYRLGLLREQIYRRLLRVCDLSTDDVRLKGKGCLHCHGTGIVGRQVCAEIIVPDETFLQHLRNKDELAAKTYWQQSSKSRINGIGCTAISHAIYKMKMGILDPNDIETQIGSLTSELDSTQKLDRNTSSGILKVVNSANESNSRGLA